MSNIVKVQSNLARNEKEEVRLPIRMSETGEHIWEELRFTNDEKQAWIDVGVIYPYVADQLRLARMIPQDLRDTPRLRKYFESFWKLDQAVQHCIEAFNEQQHKKIDPFYGFGQLG
jgi:hypothetical protein